MVGNFFAGLEGKDKKNIDKQVLYNNILDIHSFRT